VAEYRVTDGDNMYRRVAQHISCGVTATLGAFFLNERRRRQRQVIIYIYKSKRRGVATAVFQQISLDHYRRKAGYEQHDARNIRYGGWMAAWLKRVIGCRLVT
jgi:hypothetical protein